MVGRAVERKRCGGGVGDHQGVGARPLSVLRTEQVLEKLLRLRLRSRLQRCRKLGVARPPNLGGERPNDGLANAVMGGFERHLTADHGAAEDVLQPQAQHRRMKLRRNGGGLQCDAPWQRPARDCDNLDHASLVVGEPRDTIAEQKSLMPRAAS